mmetsp:Transcript_15654/g.59544  ORF Transcript_15654/g.59544 Transcript_15654/m.59544 type:complete len:304 (-) Transcript_15654:74-985(-)
MERVVLVGREKVREGSSPERKALAEFSLQPRRIAGSRPSNLKDGHRRVAQIRIPLRVDADEARAPPARQPGVRSLQRQVLSVLHHPKVSNVCSREAEQRSRDLYAVFANWHGLPPGPSRRYRKLRSIVEEVEELGGIQLLSQVDTYVRDARRRFREGLPVQPIRQGASIVRLEVPTWVIAAAKHNLEGLRINREKRPGLVGLALQDVQHPGGLAPHLTLGKCQQKTVKLDARTVVRRAVCGRDLHGCEQVHQCHAFRQSPPGNARAASIRVVIDFLHAVCIGQAILDEFDGHVHQQDLCASCS